MTAPILAWHGDPALKAGAVERMKRHREQDEFIRGTYADLDPDAASQFRGCFHGCLVLERIAEREGVAVVDVLERARGRTIEWWQEAENEFGIPWVTGSDLDSAYESIADAQRRGDWAVAVTEAIPVGADLSGVAAAYALLLPENDYDDDPDALLRLLADAPVVAP